MKNDYTFPAERELIFSAVLEVMENGNADIESGMTKIVKAIAASGSYWLSFLNIVYSRLINVKSYIKSEDIYSIEREIDLLIKAISETRNKI